MKSSAHPFLKLTAAGTLAAAVLQPVFRAYGARTASRAIVSSMQLS